MPACITGTQEAGATADPWSRGRGHVEGPTQHQGMDDTTGEEPSAVTPRQDAERGRGRELVVTTTNELVAISYQDAVMFAAYSPVLDQLRGTHYLRSYVPQSA